MKLVNPRLGLEVELSENQVLNITVESPVKFSEVVYHICRQAGGEEGEFILSDIEKELSMGKRTVVINNPLTVNCEEKRILSQLYKNLSEKILEDHFEEFATVNQKVIQFMDKVTSSSEYNLTYDVDFQAAGLIKYCNVHMDSCYDNLTEKFIDYLRTMKQICTNHLDVDAKDELKKALREYRGSILLICHEPEFYQDVVNEVWDMSKWTTKIF